MNLTRILVSTKNLLVKQGASIKALLRYSSNIAFEDIPNVSPSQIKLVLKKHNISYDEGFTNFIISCPSCQTGTNVKRCMYINKTTGMYLCASCHTTGQWSSIQEIMTKRKPHVNAATEQSELKVMKQILEQIRENTNPIHVLDEQSRKHVLSYLMENSFSSTTSFSFGTLDVRIDSTNRNIYFPLENALSEVVGYKVLDTVTKKESALPSSMCTGILTSRHLRNKDAAIVVPYLKDFLVLLNGKISASIVCLTNGLTHLPQHVLPSLERFKKLILWFGNDSMSWESARLFAKKLGEKRCLFIRPTEQYSLPHLVDSTKDLKSIIASAQPMWHKSITTFSNLREDVLFDLHNFDQVQGIKWKRFPSLNKILKGHRRGELTVITGPTGCGKTTFISEYSLDLAQQGVNTLWGSFEITNSRLARTMLQQLAGIPLEEHLDQFNYWADQFELLPIYFLTFHGQQSLKVVMEAVEHATYIHDISHVIIDNLQFMMGMVDDERNIDRFWRQDAIVAAFRMFATRKNCHVTLVIHPRKERTNEDLTASSIFGGAKASQEADNVLLIQDKRLVSVRGKKYLQVVKNRYTGDLGVMPMEFDKSGLSYAQKKKKAPEQKEETGPITS